MKQRLLLAAASVLVLFAYQNCSSPTNFSQTNTSSTASRTVSAVTPNPSVSSSVLTVSPISPMAHIGSPTDGTAQLTVSGGTAPYSYSFYNWSGSGYVAGGSISNTGLYTPPSTFAAELPYPNDISNPANIPYFYSGANIIEISDSSNPVKKAVVAITIYAPGPHWIFPRATTANAPFMGICSATNISTITQHESEIPCSSQQAASNATAIYCTQGTSPCNTGWACQYPTCKN